MTAIINHIKMIHDCAAGISGKIVLASYGENITAKVKHFQVGQTPTCSGKLLDAI